MTDNEIIKALECCGNIVDSTCKECVYHETYNASCVVRLMRDSLDLINRQKAEIERWKNKKIAKCGTCYYSKPTIFGKSKCYVECTNQEHIDKFCRYRKISLKRQRTTPACKNYKEMVGDE